MTPILLWSMLVIQSRHSVPHTRKYGERGDHRHAAKHDGDERREQDRLVQRNRVPREAAENELGKVEVIGHRSVNSR
jgi:hypothetical protein